MPAFQINDDEWGALVEEPGDIFLVYCSIRRVMDYRSGVAGQTRRISEQMISEVLYVAPIRGRHESGSPTRQRVRSVLDRLVKLGVLVPIGPLVFELPLATRDSPSKRSTTDEQPDQQPDHQPNRKPTKPSNGAAYSESDNSSTTASESGETGNNNLPPVSGNPMVMMFPRGEHFSMPLDGWEPNPRTFKAIAFKNAVPITALTPERLAAFCSYWHVRPEKAQSQGQWEYQLVDHLKKQIHFAANSEGKANAHPRPGFTEAEANPERATGGRHGRKGPVSAVDRVRANNAASEAARQAARTPVAEDGGDVRPPLDVEFWRQS